MENRALLEKAKEAMKLAYAPYSNFSVGAAILCENGDVYTGCNIENAAYGATNCAERTAIFKAVSEGVKTFSKIAIVSSSVDLTFPCGICRQVMAEFMPDGVVVLQNSEGKIFEYKVSELLPNSFKL